jgi:hypothetical protein
LKYNGQKNYFNQTSGFCNVVTSCTDNQTYDYLTNTCSQITVDPNSFPKNNQTSNSSTNNTGILIIPQINCVNGYIPVNSTLCICYKGWSDSQNQSGGIVTKCDKVIDGFSNSTITNSNNSTTSTSTYYPSNNTNTTNISDPNGDDLPMVIKNLNI